jgi:hypothetical protein
VQALSLVGLGIFFVGSLASGLRLLALARRNRGLPELLIALGILGIGPAGFAFSAFAMLAMEHGPAAARALMAAASLAIATGSVANYVFNWKVFRPGAGFARILPAIAAAVYAVSFAGNLATGGFQPPLRMGPFQQISSLTTTATLLWGAAESLAYWAKMRRRLRIGLADPEVTNRFLLWGLAIGSAGVGSAISVGVMLASGRSFQDLPGLMLSNSLFGLAAAVGMWVAFLPPAAYRRWIAARASRFAAEPQRP